MNHATGPAHFPRALIRLKKTDSSFHEEVPASRALAMADGKVSEDECASSHPCARLLFSPLV